MVRRMQQRGIESIPFRVYVVAQVILRTCEAGVSAASLERLESEYVFMGVSRITNSPDGLSDVPDLQEAVLVGPTRCGWRIALP